MSKINKKITKVTVDFLNNKYSKTAIESSYDYELFSLLPNNRPIKQAHIKRLVDKIKIKDLKQPIQINEEFQILDGQHRFYAYQQLKLSIPYFINNSVSEADIAVLNSTTSKWSDKDYLHYWLGKEKEENINHGAYQTLNWFLNKYKVVLPMGVFLLSSIPHVKTAGFREGKLKIRNLELAKERAEFIISLKPYFEYYKKVPFLQALYYLMRHKDFSLERMYQAISKNSSELHGQASRNGYIANLLKVYNKGISADKQFNKTVFNASASDEVADDIDAGKYK
tara:strand:+ start:276 stop:1121 length:846 start_codon:yes stop_codon:yes gene_type:complete